MRGTVFMLARDGRWRHLRVKRASREVHHFTVPRVLARCPTSCATHRRRNEGMTFNSVLRAGAILAASIIPPHVWAQTATISGNLSAFDVVNDTGQPVHGF